MQTIISIIALLVLLLGVGLSIFRYIKAQKEYERERYNRGNYEAKEPKFSVKRVIISVAVAFLLFGANQCYRIIPTGYSGIKVTLGQISEQVTPPGFTTKMPFTQDIKLVNNKIQETSLFEGGEKIWGESSDRIEVYMADTVVQYRIEANASAWILANVTDYEKSLVNSRIASAPFKSASNALEAVDVTKRDKIEPLAKEKLQQALDEIYGEGSVTIIAVHIADMNFRATCSATSL